MTQAGSGSHTPEKRQLLTWQKAGNEADLGLSPIITTKSQLALWWFLRKKRGAKEGMEKRGEGRREEGKREGREEGREERRRKGGKKKGKRHRKGRELDCKVFLLLTETDSDIQRLTESMFSWACLRGES